MIVLTERFRLGLDEVRFVADWMKPDDVVLADLPAELAHLVCLRRADESGS